MTAQATWMPSTEYGEIHNRAELPESRATHRAGQIRVDLRPNQTMHIDRDKDQSLDLKCGADAKTLSVASGARGLAFDGRN